MVSSREQALRKIDFVPQIFKPDDILLNGQALTLQMRGTRPDYEVDDIIAFATYLGNIIEVGKVVQLGGENSDRNTIRVGPLAEDTTGWSAEFLKGLKKDNQKLFGYRILPNDTGRKLVVEVSLPIIEAALGLLPENPVNPRERLDANNDKQITREEVSQFVKKVREQINLDKESFQIDDLVENIPESLDVTDVQVSRAPIESYYWNNVAVNILQRQLHIKAENFFVTKINHNSQEVERILLEDSTKDIRDRIIVVPGNFLFNDEAPWKTHSHYVNVIDKRSDNVIVRDEKIESIKKLKKCGKCYYRIGLADNGLVSTIHPGNFASCLFTINIFDPDDC